MMTMREIDGKNCMVFDGDVTLKKVLLEGLWKTLPEEARKAILRKWKENAIDVSKSEIDGFITSNYCKPIVECTPEEISEADRNNNLHDGLIFIPKGGFSCYEDARAAHIKEYTKYLEELITETDVEEFLLKEDITGFKNLELWKVLDYYPGYDEVEIPILIDFID